MPTVSVIVPVYNVEKYLCRCIDSILAQTFSDFELILVDDGSPDNCPTICDEYTHQDSHVRVIHQENQGQSAARNNGVKNARGEWICFVDSDDMIHPQMLEHLYCAAVKSGSNISMCGAIEGTQLPTDFLANRLPDFSLLEMNESGLEQLYHQGEYRYWVVWGKLIRRDIIIKYPFEPGRIYEDNAIVCRWLYEAKTVSNTQQRYYFYQTNPEGTTKSRFTRKKLDVLWALEEQIAFYSSLYYTSMEKKIVACYLTKAAWYSSRVRNELNNPIESAKIRRKMRCLIRKHPLIDLTLTDAERKSIRQSFHPLYVQLVRLPQVVQDTLHEGGIKSLLARVLRKFRKY